MDEDKSCAIAAFVDVKVFADQFEKQINMLAERQYKLWELVISLICGNTKKACDYCIAEYIAAQYDRWNEYVHVEKNNPTCFAIATNKSTIEEHEKISESLRNKINSAFVQQPIEDTKFLTKIKNIPIVIQETFLKDKNNEIKKDQPTKSSHLFVLVHGYQGSANDLRTIKSCITLNYPNHKFLCSNKNLNETKEDILEMGKTLATEVKNFIKEEIYHDSLTKISFIGHSLGGLIIRAALPWLQEFKPKFHLYMSLSSPHLGLMYGRNSLVNTGVWLLNALTSSKSLQQLSMNDSPILENTVLYKLSTFEGLNWFRYIVFVSSHNDSYSPFESSRIELNDKVFKDLVRGGAYIKMSDNILSRINSQTVYKLDVDFKIDNKKIDKIIGRAAHIEFLDDEFWAKIVISNMGELFE